MTNDASDRSTPWPALLLVAAVIIAVVAVLTAVAAGSSGLIGTPASFAHPTATPPGPITDLRRIFEEPVPDSLVGRRIELAESGIVHEVLSEEAIWVGDDDARVLVVLDDAADVDDLDDGQRVLLTGHVERMPSPEDARTRWGFPEQTLDELSRADVYVVAESIEVVDEPNGG